MRVFLFPICFQIESFQRYPRTLQHNLNTISQESSWTCIHVHVRGILTPKGSLRFHSNSRSSSSRTKDPCCLNSIWDLVICVQSPATPATGLQFPWVSTFVMTCSASLYETRHPRVHPSSCFECSSETPNTSRLLCLGWRSLSEKTDQLTWALSWICGLKMAGGLDLDAIASFFLWANRQFNIDLSSMKAKATLAYSSRVF